jgi:methanogenic corrinoid protein MtbC1
VLITGAEAMESVLAILGSALVGDLTRKVAGTGLLDSVEVDLNEIGKLLLGTMLIVNG